MSVSSILEIATIVTGSVLTDYTRFMDTSSIIALTGVTGPNLKATE